MANVYCVREANARLRTVATQNKIYCPRHMKSYPNKEVYCRHLVERHGSFEGVYVCTMCGIGGFETRTEMHTHMHVTHVIDSGVQCLMCSSTFANLDELGEHLAQKHAVNLFTLNSLMNAFETARTLHTRPIWQTGDSLEIGGGSLLLESIRHNYLPPGDDYELHKTSYVFCLQFDFDRDYLGIDELTTRFCEILYAALMHIFLRRRFNVKHEFWASQLNVSHGINMYSSLRPGLINGATMLGFNELLRPIIESHARDLMPLTVERLSSLRRNNLFFVKELELHVFTFEHLGDDNCYNPIFEQLDIASLWKIEEDAQMYTFERSRSANERARNKRRRNDSSANHHLVESPLARSVALCVHYVQYFIDRQFSLGASPERWQWHVDTNPLNAKLIIVEVKKAAFKLNMCTVTYAFRLITEYDEQGLGFMRLGDRFTAVLSDALTCIFAACRSTNVDEATPIALTVTPDVCQYRSYHHGKFKCITYHECHEWAKAFLRAPSTARDNVDTKRRRVMNCYDGNGRGSNNNDSSSNSNSDIDINYDDDRTPMQSVFIYPLKIIVHQRRFISAIRDGELRSFLTRRRSAPRQQRYKPQLRARPSMNVTDAL